MAVHHIRRRKLPTGAAPCLQKLAAYAVAGEISGIAFVCLLPGNGFIADTCGDANTRQDEVRELLRVLDAKIAKRQLAGR